MIEIVSEQYDSYGWTVSYNHIYEGPEYWYPKGLDKPGEVLPLNKDGNSVSYHARCPIGLFCKNFPEMAKETRYYKEKGHLPQGWDF